MKNVKGITLIALVITIVVLLILGSIATYSGINIIRSSKFTAFLTELKVMQTQINEIYQKYRNNENIIIDAVTYYGEKQKGNTENKKTILEIGAEINGTTKEQADLVFGELQLDALTGITTQDGYMYWSNELIKKLGIENVEGSFFINVEKRSVVSYEGFEYEGNMYYIVSQLPDGLYNVGHQNPNTGKPTFEINYEKIGEDKWKITISNIQYEKYIDKWEIQYQLTGTEYWNKTEDTSFVVNEKGVYKIKIGNENIFSDEKTICVEVPELEPSPSDATELSEMLYGVIEVEFLDGSGYKTTNNPNEPILRDGMQPVYWALNTNGDIDTSNVQNNIKEFKPTTANYNKASWYQYTAQTGATDGKTSRWANATIDGSYYVWIPRYAYRIVYFNSQANEDAYRAGTLTEEEALLNGFIIGYSDARGIVDEEGKRPTNVTSETAISVNDKYFRTHPAFDGNPDDGGWDSKLEGIWVMKYEASRNDASITSTGSGIIPMSVPNVIAWGDTNVSDMFTYAKNLNTTLNSHMMKNSEWGAVAYLAESKYGRNGIEISVNQCYNNITGVGRGTGNNDLYNSIYAYTAITDQQKYTGTVGQLSSTTGNIYGIYDLSGGNYEFLMGFYQDEEGKIHIGNVETNNSGFNGYLNNGNEYKNGIEFPTEKKYIQLYKNTTNSYSNIEGGMLGDAIKETKNWNGDGAYFVYSDGPVFLYGGYYDSASSAGLFSFYYNVGYINSSYGFRVCCAVK